MLFGQFGQIIGAFKNKKQATPVVSVQEVTEIENIRVFEAPGRVLSQHRVTISARISGFLEKLYVKEGDHVKKGDPLFLIEPREYQNAADNLRAQLTLAEKQHVRAKELVAKDYISKSQYDQTLAQRDMLRAQYNDALRNLGYTKVTATVDGQVGMMTITVGNFVSPASSTILTINSTDPIFVTFPLEIKDFTLLTETDGADSKNRKVELMLPGGQIYGKAGVQDFQDNVIDQTTGTVNMRATFANPDNELINGELVTIKLFSNKTVKIPIVPQVAVQSNQAGKYVYTVDDESVAHLTYIKVGAQEGNYYIVNEGLKAGDRVVVDGVQKVMPGKPVNVKNSD